MNQPGHEDRLASVARQYYLENQSKVDIGKAHGISRFQVARLLDEARNAGIVTIEIHPPSAGRPPDSEQLQQRLGLERIIVTPGRPAAGTGRDLLAQAVAEELTARASAGATIGISWSRTMDAAAERVSRLPACDLVQLAGALPVPGSGNSVELVQQLGRITGGETWPIWAPLVVDDSATAAGLRRQPEIASALRKADSLDVAVVAIGGWERQASTVWDTVGNKDRREASAAGAIAECSARLFDSTGSPVRTNLDSRVIGVTLEQLISTPTVIGVAHGAAAARGVLAAAQAGIITTLVADDELTAELSRTVEQRA
ncbi:sugar-binding domain-containing protein [Saxibacter everestensis]|uniref:Sugar-binding domain-containing protein n=1 Tax=Saxibacter everestensis TaxID=2909229 RepID=A0ABY8QVH4_9MICO|nr:sugar-binding domain-containing protein [Brevibacteriaceae bacterium ZFBP1038]